MSREIKICPFLKAGAMANDVGGHDISCIREYCALWSFFRNECGLKVCEHGEGVDNN